MWRWLNPRRYPEDFTEEERYAGTVEGWLMRERRLKATLAPDEYDAAQRRLQAAARRVDEQAERMRRQGPMWDRVVLVGIPVALIVAFFIWAATAGHDSSSEPAFNPDNPPTCVCGIPAWGPADLPGVPG